MTDRIELRPLRREEAGLVQPLPAAAFADLDLRMGRSPPPWTEERCAWFDRRVEHFLAHDPDRQFVAVRDGELVGVAMASVREGLWGLSLLVVLPGIQSAGLGRRLMDAALGSHDGRGVIVASDDGRALHRYAAAGFALYPCLEATGRADLAAYVADAHVHGGVEPGFADAVDRVARGAGHGPDHELLATRGFALRYEDGVRRGYAYVGDGGWIGLLAGTDEAAASALLWAALARLADSGTEVVLDHLTGGQPWATDIAVASRLRLKLGGAVCWRGMPEPRAYLPSGALL
jgi:GNAT superfamily N-acetyltransferase